MTIKRNKRGKCSVVNGSDKYVTYKRITDLRNEDVDLLKKYNLKKSIYIYFGQCKASRIKQRSYDFTYKVFNKINQETNEIDSKITIEVETAIAYQNIIRFFIEEKGMTKKQAIKHVFRSKESFVIIKNNLTKRESIELETNKYHSYMIVNRLTDEIVLLKNNDSKIYDTENSIKLKNSKKKKDAPKIEIGYEFDFITKKSFITVDDIKIYCPNLKFIQNNDIIEEESLKIDKKIPSTSPNKKDFKYICF